MTWQEADAFHAAERHAGIPLSGMELWCEADEIHARVELRNYAHVDLARIQFDGRFAEFVVRESDQDYSLFAALVTEGE